MTVRKYLPYIKKEIALNHQSLSIIEFNLYNIILEILNEKDIYRKNFQMEQKRGSQFILNATRKSLRLTLDNDLVIHYMKDKVKHHDIVFITGVGSLPYHSFSCNFKQYS